MHESFRFSDVTGSRTPRGDRRGEAAQPSTAGCSGEEEKQHGAHVALGVSRFPALEVDVFQRGVVGCTCGPSPTACVTGPRSQTPGPEQTADA